MVRLLSLDFDGTLVGPWRGEEVRVCPELLACLEGLREKGVLIAWNTGRTLALVDQGLQIFPLRPDFALTTERDLFRWDDERWEELGDWNQKCRIVHDAMYRDAEHLLETIASFVTNKTGARLYLEDDRLQGVVARSNDEMDRIAEFLQTRRHEVPAFSYQRNNIYLRFCHHAYDKGTVLGELQRILRIAPSETFAAGDNYNDLPMLSPKRADWLACPANSVAEVKAAVDSHGGFYRRARRRFGSCRCAPALFPGAVRLTRNLNVRRLAQRLD